MDSSSARHSKVTRKVAWLIRASSASQAQDDLVITSLLTGRARPCSRGERVPAHGTSSLAAGGCRSADGGRNGRPEPSAVQSGQATPCPDRVLADLRRRAWRGGAANGGRPRHGRGKGGAGGATALVTVLITAQAMAPCVAGSAPVILEPEHTSGGSRLRSESRSIAAPVSPNLTRTAARPAPALRVEPLLLLGRCYRRVRLERQIELLRRSGLGLVRAVGYA